MTLPDHHRTLGVADSATDEEIHQAFRRLARECHPDRHADDPAAEQRFKEIAEAHTVLTDPARRAAYNHQRCATQAALPATLAATLGRFFGGLTRPRPRPPTPRADIGAEVRIPFLVAARGGHQPLTIRHETPCAACRGAGTDPQRPGTTCMACSGEGVVATARTISVRIPPGIEDGARLHLTGQGRSGAEGDLCVTVRVDRHSQWRREGFDVRTEMSLDIVQAVLGATLAVDTLDGSADLEIPPGTQPNSRFRLRGHGIAKSPTGKERGDHFVRVQVAIPRDLSDEARRLFQKFARGADLTDPLD